jgi:tRNA nucleotidyltransferase (CCA-adding enzyme)
VSPAFVEDPVRILRVARFAARLAALGFRLAPETAALMHRMVDNGEINSLVSERVWREMQRALGEARPEVFFDVLQDCGALAVLLPELDWRAPERATMQRAARLSAEQSVRFAALLADAAPQATTALCERLRVPNDYRELALLTARLWQRIAGAETLDAAGVLELLEAADAFRRPDRFELLLRATQARSGSDDSLHAALAVALVTAAGVTLPPEQIAQLKGIAIAAAYRAARIERLQQLQSERRKS